MVMTLLKGKHGYLWVTFFFFLISLVGHWVFAWWSFVNEQAQHGGMISVNEYMIVTLRDTFENWQSEFLQLIWQVAGLAYLLYVGSPQSKEGDERQEGKLDAILKILDPKGAEKVIDGLERSFPKK